MTKIETCVVLAAGKGRRIGGLPMTRILPKCMLPICDRPILHHVIDNVRQFSISDVRMVVGESNSVIEQYFGDGSEFGLNISYLIQNEPKGIAHAIGLLENLVHTHFLVILGDDLTFASNLPSIEILFHAQRAGAVEAIVREVDIETLRRTCTVEITKGNQITNLIEKPRIPTSYLRGCGVYIFDPVVFDYIRETPISPVRGELEITDTLRLMAHDNLVFAFELEGENVNINTTQDLFHAISLAMQSNRQPTQLA